jgi:hypothetical protein
MSEKQHFKHKTLFIGITLCLIGSLLLLWQLNLLPSLGRLWPIPPLIIGIYCLYRVIKYRISKLLLIGTFLTLFSGFFLLYLNILPYLPDIGVEKIWPIFMLLTGAAIMPYAFFKKTPAAKIAIVIPSAFIIFLSIIFLLFSLKCVEGTFIDFASKWWPTLIILMGAIFIIIYFIRKKQIS